MALCLLFVSGLRRSLQICVALLGCAWGGSAVGQDMSLAELQSVAQRWVQGAVFKSSSDYPGLRMESSVGALDGRLRLATCGAVEVYIPAGARLWGRSRVGLRCADGMARWNVSLPVVVKAFGTAWVLKSQTAGGVKLAESDVVGAEVDWAEESAAVLSKRDAWVGQTTTRTLMAGQALRDGMLRPSQVFQAGAPLRVVAQGPGFQVSTEAQALSAGIVGQQARVRMDSGRVVSGTVLDVHTVRVDL